MRREWVVALLMVILLVPVGCGPAEQASAASREGSGPSTSLGTSGTYKVQSGDTLMGISRKLFNGDAQYWDEIAELNSIKAPHTIYPGQELRVPKGGGETAQAAAQSQAASTASRTYTVQSGDCLMGIARNLLGDPHRWREIADLNGIGPPYTIYPGKQLKLPEK